MKDESWYEVVLKQFAETLKERAVEAVQQRDRHKKESSDYVFQGGRVLAYYEVVSMLQNRARNFCLDLAELKLDDIDPDRDLV